MRRFAVAAAGAGGCAESSVDGASKSRMERFRAAESTMKRPFAKWDDRFVKDCYFMIGMHFVGVLLSQIFCDAQLGASPV